MDEEEDTDVEVLDGDAVVDVSEAEIAAELQQDPVTKPHDGGEWLQGYNRGVPAGRKDVIDALKRVLGAGALADEILAKVTAMLKGGPLT